MLSTQTLLGCLAVAYMAIRAYKRSSLDTGGIAAAIVIGIIHAIHPFRIIVLLLAFFLAGTRLTHWGGDIKADLLHQQSSGKGRTATQVLCNSAPATICALIHLMSSSPVFKHDLLVYAIVAQYACSAADTFSSEIGILNDDWPVLITTFRKVPPGTNGAISVLGIIAALMGGSFIGVVAAIVIPCDGILVRFALMLVGTFAGLLGSLLDSVLGATLQRTVYDTQMKKVIELHGGQAVATTKEHEDRNNFIVIGKDVLDNNMVNLVSAVMTMIITVATIMVISTILSLR